MLHLAVADSTKSETLIDALNSELKIPQTTNFRACCGAKKDPKVVVVVRYRLIILIC